MTNEQQQVYQHFQSIGFSKEEIKQALLILISVDHHLKQASDGFHLWRFSRPLREMAERLVKLGLLRLQRQELFPLWYRETN